MPGTPGYKFLLIPHISKSHWQNVSTPFFGVFIVMSCPKDLFLAVAVLWKIHNGNCVVTGHAFQSELALVVSH